MPSFADKIPTILVLAVLVGIFVALRRRVKSPRLNLWTVAWFLIFIHFLAGMFQPHHARPYPLVWIIDQGALLLSAVFFIASLTSFFENKKLTASLVVLAGAPAMAMVTGNAYDLDSRFLYIASFVTVFFAAPLFVAIFRRLTIEALFWVPALVVLGTVSVYRAWHHDYDFGSLAVYSAGFGLPAFLYRRRYRNWSPGVITSAGGFVLWALVFPVGHWFFAHMPALRINPELFNTPKFFVAFGMILTLLEEKSDVLESAIGREHEVNRQMQRFAGITSRLLTGADLTCMCHEVAAAICETSTFRRVSIILSTDSRTLYLAGHAGLDEPAVEQIKQNCAKLWTVDHIVEIFQIGSRLGSTSRLLRAADLGKYNLSLSDNAVPVDPRWSKGDRIFIPLQSTRGAYVGTISVDDPQDLDRVNAEEMSKIELLAGDLAVTVDNASLHRQLARAEKLAAMGQLVAGVAHELNNPLTSIIGYSELLTDDIKDGPARQKLDKMNREAQRMRRIIENLLRFARQNNLEKKSANLQVLLQEVLALREYHIRNRDVEVEIHCSRDLPRVAVDEDQFKQILLNLLNNSMDALENCRSKRISIEAVRRGDRVVLCFDDSGPGFSDPNRVFDPFYTTKPVGKGTGLGLSICYGIVKEHGGEIQALNLESGGARIALDLPVQTVVDTETITVG
jgi:two-component system, NtrC family, sensor kinase